MLYDRWRENLPRKSVSANYTVMTKIIGPSDLRPATEKNRRLKRLVSRLARGKLLKLVGSGVPEYQHLSFIRMAPCQSPSAR